MVSVTNLQLNENYIMENIHIFQQVAVSERFARLRLRNLHETRIQIFRSPPSTHPEEEAIFHKLFPFLHHRFLIVSESLFFGLCLGESWNVLYS